MLRFNSLLGAGRQDGGLAEGSIFDLDIVHLLRGTGHLQYRHSWLVIVAVVVMLLVHSIPEDR